MLPAIRLPYLEYVELALDVLAPFVNLYFLFLLRRPVFHLNLRILMAHFSIGLASMTFFRMLILTDSMSRSKYLTGEAAFWINLTHSGFVITLLNASVLMAGERLIATILVDRYERVSYWPITVVMCAVMWLINMYISYFTMIRAQNAVILPNGQTSFGQAQYNMDIVYTLIGLTIMNCAGVVVFFALLRFNQKRWIRDTTKRLGHRYQIAENVRTSKQLAVVLMANLVINAYLFFVLYYMLAVSRRNRLTETLSQFFDLVDALTAIFLPCLLVKMHPTLQDSVRSHIFLDKIAMTKVVAPSGINDGNVYFQELAKSWQVDEKKRLKL